MDPQCHFCDVSLKGRCKTQEEADDCKEYASSPAGLKKKLEAEKFENDFGFTFIDDNIETTTRLEAEIDERTDVLDEFEKEIKDLLEKNEILDRKAKQIYNAIIPFLDNLCKNPDQPNIKWPNRVEKITAFKEKLKDILEGN